jgi:hypothetical protein
MYSHPNKKNTNFQNNNLSTTITNLRTTIEQLKRADSVSGKSYKLSILNAFSSKKAGA